MLHGIRTFVQQQENQQVQFASQYFLKQQSQRSAPMSLSFKGMILVEMWQKSSKNANNIDLQLNSELQKVKRKRESLFRWFFKASRQKITRQTISKILCQQSISKGSFLYRLKSLVAKQMQSEQKQIEYVEQEMVKSKQKYQEKYQEKSLQKNKHTNNIKELKNQQIQQLGTQDNQKQQEINEKRQIVALPFQEKKRQPKIEIEKIKPKKIAKQDINERLIKQLQHQMHDQFQRLDQLMQKIGKVQHSSQRTKEF